MWRSLLSSLSPAKLEAHGSCFAKAALAEPEPNPDPDPVPYPRRSPRSAPLDRYRYRHQVQVRSLTQPWPVPQAALAVLRGTFNYTPATLRPGERAEESLTARAPPPSGPAPPGLCPISSLAHPPPLSPAFSTPALPPPAPRRCRCPDRSPSCCSLRPTAPWRQPRAAGSLAATTRARRARGGQALANAAATRASWSALAAARAVCAVPVAGPPPAEIQR